MYGRISFFFFLFSSQSSDFIGRIVLPGLESSLLDSERELLPKDWNGFLSNQFTIRQRIIVNHEPVPPLFVSMPYPLPILVPQKWSKNSIYSSSLSSSSSSSSSSYLRSIFILLYGDATKPSPGRLHARSVIGQYDRQCLDQEAPVCWQCNNHNLNKANHMLMHEKHTQQIVGKYRNAREYAPRVVWEAKINETEMRVKAQYFSSSTTLALGDAVVLNGEVLQAATKNDEKEKDFLQLKSISTLVGYVVGIVGSSIENRIRSASGDMKVRVAYGSKVIALKAKWLMKDEIGHCEDVTRYDHFWQLTVSVFHVGPPCLFVVRGWLMFQ
jgi:hypothetical protein